MDNIKTVFYTNENEELYSTSPTVAKLDSDFKYIHRNIFWKFFAFVSYRIIMKPIAFLFCKIKFRLRIENKSALKKHKKDGYVIYSNHTLLAGDAFIPNCVNFLKKTYVIVNPDNISKKGTSTFIQMCGAIPTPSSLSNYRDFNDTIKKRIDDGNVVYIYPEAHVWPYCDFIRDFGDSSFSYPIKYDCPSYSATVTYQKRKHGKVPKVTVYIDGPFYKNSDLKVIDARKDLRDRVYETMKERSKNTTYKLVNYQKKEI